MQPGMGATTQQTDNMKPLKIEITDVYLLKELIASLTRVCQTCPFLKSKTSSFITNSFNYQEQSNILPAKTSQTKVAQGTQ